MLIHSSASSRRWRAVLAAGLLAMLAVLAVPALLSMRWLRDPVAHWLAHRLDVPLEFDAIELGWRRPTAVRGLRATDANGVWLQIGAATLDLTLFDVLRRRPPTRVAATGVDLRVGAASDVAMATRQRQRLCAWLGRPMRLHLGRTVVRLAESDARIDPLELELESDERDLRHLLVRGQLHAADGRPGSFELRYARATSTQLDVKVDDLSLTALLPIVHALYGEGELAGRASLAGSLTLDRDLIRARLDGSLGGLLLRIPGLVPTPIREGTASFAGGFELRPTAGQLLCDHLRIVSSIFGIEAHGSLAPDPTIDRFDGDLRVHASIDLPRFATRTGPLANLVLGGAGVSGDLVLDISRSAPGIFPTRLSAQGLAFRLPGVGDANLHDCFVAGDLSIGADRRSVSLADALASFRFGDLRGDLALRGAADTRIDGEFDVRYQGELEFAEEQLGGLHPGVDLQPAGAVDVHVRGHADAAQLTLDATLHADPWFDVTHVRGSDLTHFQGEQLQSELHLTRPRASRLGDWRGWRASLSATAPRAILLRDPVEEFRFSAQLDDGLVRLERCEMKGARGGTIQAGGEVDLRTRPPALHLQASATDIAVRLFAAELAARTTGLFAAAPFPWTVEADNRMDVSLTLDASGFGATDFANSMRGHGQLTIGAGETMGAPVLERLIDPDRGSAPRTVERIDARFELLPGRIDSNVVLRVPDGRQIRFGGSSSARGVLDFVVPPDQLLDADFRARQRDKLTNDMFRIGGKITAPELLLPNKDSFQFLVDDGRWEEAVLGLRGGR